MDISKEEAFIITQALGVYIGAFLANSNDKKFASQQSRKAQQLLNRFIVEGMDVTVENELRKRGLLSENAVIFQDLKVGDKFQLFNISGITVLEKINALEYKSDSVVYQADLQWGSPVFPVENN